MNLVKSTPIEPKIIFAASVRQFAAALHSKCGAPRDDIKFLIPKPSGMTGFRFTFTLQPPSRRTKCTTRHNQLFELPCSYAFSVFHRQGLIIHFQSPGMASIWLLVPLLSAATAWMYFLTLIAPSVPAEKANITLKFPGNLEELQSIAQLIRMYYDVNWIYVLVLYSSAYIYKQTFAIPGTVFLNVLGGALFGVVVGFPFCCFLTATGASCCYLLSAACGQDIVQKFFPNQLKNFQDKVQRNSHQLLYYLLFLRMFPMSPNWLINVIAPLVGVPLPLFFFTVLFGLGPYVLVCTQAGVILSTLTSLEQLFSVKTALQMALLAVAALTPSFVFRKTQTVS